MSLREFIFAGSWSSLAIVAVGLVALPLSAAGAWLALAPARRRAALLGGVILASLAAVALLVGLAAWLHEVRGVEAAVAIAPPEAQGVLRLRGGAEARGFLALGLTAALVPLAAAGFVAGVAGPVTARRPRLTGALLALGIAVLLGGLAATQWTLARRDEALVRDYEAHGARPPIR